MLPVDPTIQVSYWPGAGPTGHGCSDAGDFSEAGNPNPRGLYLSASRIGPADILFVCYFNVSSGAVEEQITSPTGTVVSKRFTGESHPYYFFYNASGEYVSPPFFNTVYGALPGDEPGTYTVRAETADGSYTAQFELTERTALPSTDPTMRLLGRSFETRVPLFVNDDLNLADAQYVFLANFVPDETVAVYFSAACSVRDAARIEEPQIEKEGNFEGAFSVVSGIQTVIDAAGQAFAAIPDSIRKDPRLSEVYLITAHGSSRLEIGVGTFDEHIDILFDSHGRPLNLSTYLAQSHPGNAEGAPPCPAPSTTSTQPAQASTEGTSLPARVLLLQEPRLVGTDVRAVQQRLVDLGYTEVGAVDGIFGPLTEAAVRNFQAVNEDTDDGIVDEQTWTLLFSAEARPKP